MLFPWKARQVKENFIGRNSWVFTAGEAIAESVFMTLVEHNLHSNIMAALADTTAPNFGQWRGAMAILQV